MPFYNSGLQTKRDELTIHHRRADLERVLTDFRSHDSEWLRHKYELGPDGRDWTVKTRGAKEKLFKSSTGPSTIDLRTSPGIAKDFSHIRDEM